MKSAERKELAELFYNNPSPKELRVAIKKVDWRATIDALLSERAISVTDLAGCLGVIPDAILKYRSRTMWPSPRIIIILGLRGWL